MEPLYDAVVFLVGIAIGAGIVYASYYMGRQHEREQGGG